MSEINQRSVKPACPASVGMALATFMFASSSGPALARTCHEYIGVQDMSSSTCVSQIEDDSTEKQASKEDCGRECFDEMRLAKRIASITNLFDDLYITTYRTTVFRMIGEMRQLSTDEIFARLEVVIAVAQERGADGLEPLIIAYADAIGQSKDDWFVGQAATLLGAAEIWYRHELPYEAMLQPVGRKSSRMILSARPLATRAIVNSLSKNPGVLRLEDQFNLESLQEDICNMPDVRSDADMLEHIANMDQQRQVDCEEGKIGKGSGNGRMPRSIGAIGLDACLDVSLDSIRDDDAEYTLGEQMADLDQCLKDTTNHFDTTGGNGLAEGGAGLAGWLPVEISADLGPPLQELIKQAGEAAREAGSGANEHVKKARDTLIAEWQIEQQRKRDLSDQMIQAQVDAVGAQIGLAGAQGNLDHTNDEVADAQAESDYWSEEVNAARRDTCNQCSEQEQRQYQERLADAKKKRAEADKKLKEAKEKRDETKKERDAAAKKAAEAKKKVEELEKKQGDSLDPDPFNSAACNRLMTGGVDFMDPVDMRRLPENWTDRQAWLDIVSNPDPDAPPRDAEGGDAFGLPNCGADMPTNTGVSDCSSLTHCADPSQQCSCNLDADAAEAQAQQLALQLERFSCVNTQCGDGLKPTPSGQFCSCEPEGGSDEGNHPRPRPLPIAEIFMTTDAIPAAQVYEDQDPLSGMASELFRDR